MYISCYFPSIKWKAVIKWGAADHAHAKCPPPHARLRKKKRTRLAWYEAHLQQQKRTYETSWITFMSLAWYNLTYFITYWLYKSVLARLGFSLWKLSGRIRHPLNSLPNSIFRRPLGRVVLYKLLLKCMPNDNSKRLLGREVLSKLWLKQSPKAKYERLLGRVVLSKLWSKHEMRSP